MQCSIACDPDESTPLQFSVDEASTKCRHGWMRTALHDWLRRQGWDAVADRLDNVSAAASSDDFVGVATPADTDC